MSQDDLDFSSDTSAPAHPAVLDALARANHAMAASYGSDPLTAELQSLICEIFETDAAIFPVVSGTASNALALSLLANPMESILCHDEAHIARDERGAPEFFSAGAKLSLLAGSDGKIAPETLETACATINRAFVHETPPAALSLTNLTECGTAYTPDEIRTLCDIAKRHDLATHLDGARLANALAHTGASPADMTWRAGIDVLSLGLTKTGAMSCEIICLFGDLRDRLDELRARAKRAGHMPPKMRFISAQGLALLSDGLWLELARNANDVAQALAGTLVASGEAQIQYPVEGNEVFARLSDDLLGKLQAKGLKAYPWPGGATRFVCNWSLRAATFDRIKL